MTTDPRKLNDLALAAIRAATDALANGGSVAVWEAAMRRTLTSAHTAATLAGLADRSFGGRVRQLAAKIVGVRALPKEDRARLQQAVNGQLAYLRGFVRDLPSMSDAQIAARAAMYAGATRGTYYQTRHPGLPFYPGSAQCKSNCKCSWRDDGGGRYTWVLGVAEHCGDCEARAAGSPYRVEAA